MFASSFYLNIYRPNLIPKFTLMILFVLQPSNEIVREFERPRLVWGVRGTLNPFPIRGTSHFQRIVGVKGKDWPARPVHSKGGNIATLWWRMVKKKRYCQSKQNEGSALG